jgi:hypothetical protein
MASFGQNFNPSSVMLGRGTGPYMWTGAGSKPPQPGPMPTPRPGFGGDGGVPNGPVQLPFGPGTGTPGGAPYKGVGAQTSVPAAPSGPTGVLGPRTVRSTGTGPYDQAYRQNLASYAGGQFAGNLSFNPTDVSTFPGMATGGGTAPVTGMPQSLLDQALGGQGFSWNPPAPAQTATKPPQYPDMSAWMDQFMRNGRGLRMGSFA